MCEINDDPREVLALLNSLGFVGITASQLKSFMKDLKMYRKIKEREKQLRKDELKRKILSKQQSMMKDLINENKQELYTKNEHGVLSDCTNFYNDDSVVEVKIKCIPKERKTHEHNYPESAKSAGHMTDKRECNKDNIYSRRICQSSSSYTSTNEKISDRYPRHRNISNTRSKSVESTQRSTVETQKSNRIQKLIVSPAKENRLHTAKSVTTEYKRPTSAPNVTEQKQRSRQTLSDPTGSVSTLSVAPTRASSQKSFIRPWRLQPDAQKGSTGIKKCDPVTLYQKYQQQWKQTAFPGEEKHARVRWAVREKMLGSDPHPMPLSRKSTSMPVLKKK